MPGRLQDRIALITGASSGIGRAIAFAYAKEGSKVVCADLSEGTWRADAPNDEANGTTHQRITAEGGSAIYVHCDVTEPSSVENAIAAAVKEYGRLDIMVNNAGSAREARALAPVWDCPVDTFEHTMKLNVQGVFHGIKYASAQMLKQDALPNGDRGWILNTCSVFGLFGSPGVPAYCTSKGAVANLTRAAALDCAPHKIHINAVNPGYVVSHLTDEILSDKAIADEVEQRHPFGGVGKPEKVAGAFVFLASDEASWISGINMPVDGCFTAQ